MEAGFVNPPPEARLRCYWWWLNGHTTKEAITRDLEQMHEKGYGGALLVDAGGADQQGNRPVPAGPAFGSAEWRALFRHALAEAARLHLELSLQIQSGWNLGGPAVTPDQASKILTWSRTDATGPREFHAALDQPRANAGFYRDIAVLAYPLRHGPALSARPIRDLAIKSASVEAGFSMPDGARFLNDAAPEPGEEDARVSDVRELTADLSPDGNFTWTVPAGDWEILRIGYTASGAKISTSSSGWQGLAIDHMDHDAFDTYWRNAVAPLMDDARPYLGRTLRYLTTDSWELGGTNWTGRFRDEFRARRGYDPVPYLAVVAGRILDGREASNRFLADLRRTTGDLIAHEHYAAFAETAAKYGLGLHPESGGPHGAPIDALETLGLSTFPQTEYWARSATHRTTDADRFFVKEAASAAHTYGKTIVAAEGMTSIGPQWEESLWSNLKPSFDQAVCEGLNRLFWHTFTSSPKEEGVPGQEYFAGTHLNPNVTWWNEAGAFLGYLNRVQFLMQQGAPVADVVYYYGDHVPNFAPLKAADPAGVLPGYDYDYADERVLTERMRVENGRIVLPGGVSYRILVLPNRDAISLKALRAVRQLALAGATVVGPKPVRSTGLTDSEAEIRTIAAELWDSGKVRSTPAREALRQAALAPDFEAPSGLDYIHRRTANADIYFVRNTGEAERSAEVTFRIDSKAPELWRPDAGRVEPQTVYTETADHRTRVPLHFDPYGSVFVVFRHPAGRHLTAAPPDPPVVERPVTGAWTVEFTPGWGAPASAVFEDLKSWTESPDAGIRYYSGTAAYRTKFSAPPGGHIELDLGDVREVAHVRLNGKDLGTLWKPPFRVVVDGALRSGENTLEVAVTNFWPNRLIGDALLPEPQRHTHTNIVKWRADSPLMPSGLLGPLMLRVTKTQSHR
jgi:hypothetical protein